MPSFGMAPKDATETVAVGLVGTVGAASQVAGVAEGGTATTVGGGAVGVTAASCSGCAIGPLSGLATPVDPTGVSAPPPPHPAIVMEAIKSQAANQVGWAHVAFEFDGCCCMTSSPRHCYEGDYEVPQAKWRVNMSLALMP